MPIEEDCWWQEMCWRTSECVAKPVEVVNLVSILWKVTFQSCVGMVVNVWLKSLCTVAVCKCSVPPPQDRCVKAPASAPAARPALSAVLKF